MFPYDDVIMQKQRNTTTSIVSSFKPWLIQDVFES